MFPTDDWEYLVGRGSILGVFKSELIKRPSFPPSPGTEISRAEESKVNKFIGLDQESGINIGQVQFEDLPAKLNMEKLFQKHLAILAQSGAGKSYLASVLIEELLDRNEKKGQIGLVIIDPHGEYATLAKDETYMDRVRVYKEDELQIGVPSLSTGRLEQFFPKISAAQKREMKKIIADLRNNMRQGSGPYDLNDLKEEVKRRDMSKSVKQIWLDRLNRMGTMNLFAQHNKPSPEEVEPGKAIILDLSDTINQQKRQIIAAYFSSKLFRARRQEQIPPFFLLVEEAHNFIPEKASRENAISRGILTKIAREGRKFHASLGLISQRPVGLSTTALSQCNTHFILRVTNPNDLERIKQGAEGITSDVVKTIPGLRVGEAVVVGEAVNYPLFADIRERKSKEFETGKGLEQVAKDWIKDKEQEKDDLDAFM